jgi:hypothetical protein
LRRALKVLLWTGVFAGAAAIGALVAAHSNPFPPDVSATRTSQASPSGPSTSPQQQPQVWRGSIDSSTYHELYVGGRCETDWRGRVRLTVFDDGSVRGEGVVRRVGELRCDFPVAQAQIARFQIRVGGEEKASRFTLRFVEASSTPSSGAEDYGGLGGTLLQPRARPLVLRSSEDHASGELSLRRVDREGRGVYVSRTHVRLECRSCS